MAHTVTERNVMTTAQPSTARDLSDTEFLVAFESCTLAADAFRHYDHIRLAWLYLGTAPLEVATEKMAGAIRRFALHHTGSTAKYDEALTRSWMRLVARARAGSVNAATFAVFAEENPMLFDRRRAFDFY
jgi:hypothetical protein